MTAGQRFMLLFCLFFFFVMMLLAMADWGGKKTGALVAAGIPRSVLSYPEELAADAQRSIPCYAGAQYEQFTKKLITEQYGMVVGGDLSDGDRMEIYARTDGEYVVIVRGPDKTGAMEGCQVTEGRNFTHDPAEPWASLPAAQNDAVTTPAPMLPEATTQIP
ncbi:MAG: hypothetical protein KJ667_09585 [Alphaproteobacteria bacterium]|nr:hypothetical protein [Alphaproteobacteria bacterium]